MPCTEQIYLLIHKPYQGLGNTKFSTQYTVLFQIYLISLQKFYNMSFAFLALKAKNNLHGIHLGALDFARILCLKKHYLWK